MGIKTKEGVVLGVEKKIDELQEPVKSEKLVEIDSHCGCAMSGIIGDSRILIDSARVEAQNHKFNYDEALPVHLITQAVSDLAMNFGEGMEGAKKKPMARPYGVSLLFAGVDVNGPQLYQTDPSGTYSEWKARAIGGGGDTAMGVLKEKYKDDLTLAQAENLAMDILKQVMENKISPDHVEMVVIRADDKKYNLKTRQELQTLIAALG